MFLKKIELTYCSVLLYEKVLLKNNVADIAYVLPERHESAIPMSVIGGNLGLVRDAESGSKAYNKLIHEDLYELEFKPNGVKPLWGVVATSNQVVNSKRPIKSVEDLKGLKIRISNSMQEQALNEWGATGVTINGTEMYSAWERGTV